jgi:transcriptional regulator with XRE-family HTH domain
MQATVAEARIADSIPVTLTISIGDCVRTWREYRSLRPSDLAEKAQVTRSYISSLEHNAIKNPNERHLARIADALDIDIMVLFTRQLPPVDQHSHSSRRQSFSIGDPEVGLHRSSITLGTEIERKIKKANLSTQEMQVIADSLLSVTDQMLEIVKVTR